MVYDPNKTDRWSVRDIRLLEAQEAKRRLREVFWACLGIGVMILLVVLYVLFTR